MHVEGAVPGEREQADRQHIAVIKTENEVWRERGDLRMQGRRIRIRWRDRCNAVFGTQRGDGLEPDRFGRIVVMRDHERDIDAVREQDFQAAHADAVIGEHDGAHQDCCSASGFCSRIACTT